MIKKFRIGIIMIIALLTTGVFTACGVSDINDKFYTVYFEANGGSEVSPRLVSIEDSILVSPVSIKPNNVFLGWFENNNLRGDPVEFPYTPLKTLTLYAGWQEAAQITQYTVTFIENGGIVTSGKLIQTVTEGQAAYAPTLRRFGYSYTWDKEFNNITEDTIVTAQWTENNEKKLSVDFNLNGGNLISGYSFQFVNEGMSAKAPEVKKPGYILSWDKAFNNITQNMVVNAVWTVAENYTVTFNVNGGTLKSGHLEQSITHGSDAIPPVIEKSGYVLSWDKGYKNIIENTVINAVWLSTSSNPVTTFSLGNYIDVVYDETYNKIIVLRSDSLEIYNASSKNSEKIFSFLNTPECIDTDKGIVAVGFGDARQFKLYDLSDNSILRTEITTIPVSFLVMDGDIVIYTEYDQWCDIYSYSIQSESSTYMGHTYQPRLAINRQDHILYYCETGSSSSEITYRNSISGELLYESISYQYGYNYSPVYFDGKYVHYYGNVLDRFNGSVVSQSELVKIYVGLSGYTKTILESEILGLVSSSSMVSLYDNINDRVLYTFNFSANSAKYIGKGKYFIKGSSTAAILDTIFIDGAYIGDIHSFGQEDEIAISDDGKVTSLRSSSYSNAIFDENFIYLFYKNSYSINVYNSTTFELVKSLKFLDKLECIDAANGKLVIGTGENMLLYIFDVSDWSYEILAVPTKVYSLLIYENSIIYAPINQWCDVYMYNLENKKNNRLIYSLYYVSMAINKEDGILYLGERNSSSCDLVYYDLKTNSTIYESPFSTYSYISTSITFNGAFVGYAGKAFDKNTGLQISESLKMRKYLNVQEYTGFATIYDDGEISIFTANLNGDYYTVFYDIDTNEILYRIKAQITIVANQGQSFLLAKAGSSMLFSVSLK